jgi:microsomal dipeptidase-like Zn-dependent dipeptidase
MSFPARGQATAAEMETAKHIQARVLGVDSHNDTARRILIEDVDIGQHPLTAGLLRRGYKEQKIRKIMGENDLRVIREVVGN